MACKFILTNHHFWMVTALHYMQAIWELFYDPVYVSLLACGQHLLGCTSPLQRSAARETNKHTLRKKKLCTDNSERGEATMSQYSAHQREASLTKPWSNNHTIEGAVITYTGNLGALQSVGIHRKMNKFVYVLFICVNTNAYQSNKQNNHTTLQSCKGIQWDL
jgi:hypothetical protein